MPGPRPQTKTKTATRAVNNPKAQQGAPSVKKGPSKKNVVGDKAMPSSDGKKIEPVKKLKQDTPKSSKNLHSDPLLPHKFASIIGTTSGVKSSHVPLPQTTASQVHPRKMDPAEAIQSRLKKKSPWYDSIMKPITGGGVKIPDPVGTNTGTYQHVQNVSVPVNPQGIAGLRVVSPYINSYNQPGNTNGSNYQRTSSTSTASNLAWGDGGSTGLMSAFAAIPALMKANALSHRVVSGSVTAQAETATLNDAGEMVAFVTPFRCRDSSVSTNLYNQQWDSSILPINAHKPLIARHYPLGSDWNSFDGNVTVDTTGDEVTCSYTDFLSPNMGNEESDDGVLPWEFGVVCSGMVPSSGVVRFQIVINYEFIPLTSTAMVTQAQSPQDPFEENFVLSRVASEPMTGVVPQKQASSAPSDTQVPAEETGFGMFADIIKEIVPFALALL